MAHGIKQWGSTSDGRNVERVTLRNGDLAASIISYGASIQDLRVAGHDAPLVLGFENVKAYENHGLYFGAIAGRCANRIAHGQFNLAGEKYQLTKPDGEIHHLHGGPGGFANRIWKFVEATDFEAVLELDSSDGDMGYPGHLVARCRYWIDEDRGLNIRLEAETDSPTICNLTNHAYFNLEDGGRHDVSLHRLQIDAENVCELSESLVPTGALSAVSGTQNDFRAIRPIGDFHAYDLNFCVAKERRALTEIARVVAPSSGLQMDVSTTETGVQLYTAMNLTEPMLGLDNITYVSGGALCLEAQVWPDAINHANFPSAILMPGQRIAQTTQYRFSMIA